MRILILISALTLMAGAVLAQGTPMGTAVTYQGRLNDGGTPATGQYDLTLTLHDASTGGSAVAGPIIAEDVDVNGGLFALPVDFGAGAFDGDARWMSVGVRPGASTGGFTALSPRQSMAPVPYSLVSAVALGGTDPRIDVLTLAGNASTEHLINQPGSYYLSDNIQGVAGKSGIEIVASNVTLDLTGFELVGVPGALDGIFVFNAQTNLRIFNGTVRDWPQHGIHAGNSTNNVISGITASNNGSSGVITGLRVGMNSVVISCAGLLNTGQGISVDSSSSVSDCVARENGGFGFAVGPGSTIVNCSASLNTNHGFRIENGSTISTCTAQSNDANGIQGDGTITVLNCGGHDNGGDGINVVSGSTVINCNTATNVGDGIEAGTGCSIIGNNCHQNGEGALGGDAAGIHVTEFQNRVEGNNVTLNDRGIDVDQGVNVIVRNTASANTDDYGAIVGGNDVGPIGSASTATSPWANIVF